VFASCLWSEPIVSKRSGISPGFRQRLLERAQSANAKRCHSCNPGEAAVSPARTRRLLRFPSGVTAAWLPLSTAIGKAIVADAPSCDSAAGLPSTREYRRGRMLRLTLLFVRCDTDGQETRFLTREQP
jgi:hypothetical protein